MVRPGVTDFTPNTPRIMKAEVNTEVDGALDTSITELTVQAPTATPTVRTALMLLYMALRNKTVVQTSGTDALEIYNDAGTLITKKLITDDGSVVSTLGKAVNIFVWPVRGAP